MLDWLRQQIARQGAERIALIALAIVSALAGVFLCAVTLTYAGSALMNTFSPSVASNVPGQAPPSADTTSSSDANPVFPFPTPNTYPPNPAVPIIVVGSSTTSAPAPTLAPTTAPLPTPGITPAPAATPTPTPPPAPVTYQIALSVPPNVRRGSQATATVTVSPAPSSYAVAIFSASFNIGGQQNGQVPINGGSASWSFHVPLRARNGLVTVSVTVNGQNVGTQTATFNVVGPP
jgi:hypothetical protein